MALTLANGWYKDKLGFMPQPNHYGDTTAALAALCITYEDGHEEWLGTDESWLCTTGAVQAAEIYDGETQDFTADPPHRSPPDCLTTALTPSSGRKTSRSAACKGACCEGIYCSQR